jgi:hypothetical protein
MSRERLVLTEQLYTVHFEDNGRKSSYSYPGGEITDTVRHVFSHGRCGDLAIALNRATGCQLISGANDHFAVAASMASGGYYVLDINGLARIEDWEARWGAAEETFEDDITCEDPEWADERIAESGAATFVDPVLARRHADRLHRDAQHPDGVRR